MAAPLMSHEERRKIIEAPFRCQVISPKSWAGTLIPHELPVEGGRRPVRIEDSSYLRYGAPEDPNMGDL